MGLRVPEEQQRWGSWRAERVTRRLIDQFEQDRDRSSLRELVAVASRSRGKAAPLARAALEVACEGDPNLITTLIHEWVSGRFSAASRRCVVALLLVPDPAASHEPKVRVVAFLDETSNLRLDGDGRRSVTTAELRERTPRALAQELSEQGGWSQDLAAVFAATDHPALLAVLVQCWLEKRGSGSGNTHLRAIVNNPNLPRAVGENPMVAVLKGRPDALDPTDWQTGDVLLECAGNPLLPSQAEECRRQLLQLPPGAAREHLCRLARNSAPALAVVRQAGWYPEDEAERLLFYFLTRDLRSYAVRDPDGRLLRDAYRRSDVSTQAAIRKVVRELAAARTSAAGVGSRTAGNVGGPVGAAHGGDIERGWHGFVTFDLAGFSADVGCGAAPAPAASPRGTRSGPRRRGGGLGNGGIDASGSAFGGGCGSADGGCGGGGGGCGCS